MLYRIAILNDCDIDVEFMNMIYEHENGQCRDTDDYSSRLQRGLLG